MNKELQVSWDEVPVHVQPRSRLYQLEPLGLGTSMVESLSSYLQRLAQAHGLPPWILVCRELAPQFERKSILTTNGHCDLLGKTGNTINGNNRSAREAITIIQALTGRSEIGKMTFCPLGGLVANHRILRGTQAWCPCCLEQWRENGESLYQPLIWLLSASRICPSHNCRLQDRCPRCLARMAPLARYGWDGRCQKCSTWLGQREAGHDSGETKPDSDWDTFAAGVLRRLVAEMQSLPEVLPMTTFPANVSDLVRSRFEGSVSAFARFLKIHHSTVADWASGAQRPSLGSLVSFSYCFGGEALDWLIVRPCANTRHIPRPMTEHAASIIHPPLRRHDPELLRQHLLSALKVDAQPLPSLASICKRIGVHQSVAKRLFPELAGRLIARYKLARSEGKLRRDSSRKAAVESAVQQLLNGGRTLCYNQLCRVLPAGFSTRDKLLRQEFERLRSKSMEA